MAIPDSSLPGQVDTVRIPTVSLNWRHFWRARGIGSLLTRLFRSSFWEMVLSVIHSFCIPRKIFGISFKIPKDRIDFFIQSPYSLLSSPKSKSFPSFPERMSKWAPARCLEWALRKMEANEAMETSDFYRTTWNLMSIDDDSKSLHRKWVGLSRKNLHSKLGVFFQTWELRRVWINKNYIKTRFQMLRFLPRASEHQQIWRCDHQVPGSSIRVLVRTHKWPFQGLSDVHLGKSKGHFEETDRKIKNLPKTNSKKLFSIHLLVLFQ